MAVLIAALLGGLPGTLGLAGGAGAAVPAVPACHPGSHVVCLSRTDGGHSVPVGVGQTVTVELGGSGLQWSGLREVGPHLLRQHGATVERGGALTASYVATKAGRTVLRAGGAPKCAPGEACPQFILLWQVRVVIAPRS
jgi:hypothetical protein